MPRLRKKTLAPPRAARMVEDIVGCKWSLSVLDLVNRGVSRPGAMLRSIDGLTAKVLNERLRKLIRFGIVEREVFAEVPPHVEYRLTAFGRQFIEVLARIEALDAQMP
ncbi:MAG TPA: helix-turn-helix domain-containing protein [Steroidobacteraceae bacterium]|nr:helix-turn-helix domain-containing protein [Steroidobacteraceae bacterium]